MRNNELLPELLAPAGDLEKLKVAFHYGADAVYLGASRFSLRAMAGNFDEGDLAAAVALAHERGRKAYVTANIFAHNRDLSAFHEHMELLSEAGPDGVIVSDPGLFSLFRKRLSDLPVHVSTQANITNRESALFWQDMGASRIVLARELSLDEIREIRDAVSIEIEVFVHGSLCLSYSGRCYLSSYLAHRGANRGECTNSCRWNYTLMEAKRPGEYLPVFEDDRGAYVLSPRDLCLIEHLPALREAGVDSFKLEGRMKGINYLAGVVKTYREAVDALGSGDYSASERWRGELAMFGSRGYCTGLLYGPARAGDYDFDARYAGRMGHQLVGVVESLHEDYAMVALRNRLAPGDAICAFTPGVEDKEFEITRILDHEGGSISQGGNGQRVRIHVPGSVREGDLLRRVVS